MPTNASSEEDEAPPDPQYFTPSSPALIRPSNLRCVTTLSGHHSGIRAIAVANTLSGSSVYTRVSRRSRGCLAEQTRIK